MKGPTCSDSHESLFDFFPGVSGVCPRLYAAVNLPDAQAVGRQMPTILIHIIVRAWADGGLYTSGLFSFYLFRPAMVSTTYTKDAAQLICFSFPLRVSSFAFLFVLFSLP